MRKLSFFNKVIFIGNIGAGVALVASFFATATSPQTFWVMGFLGLLYPVLLVTNILFLVYWVLRKKRVWITALIFVLVGGAHYSDYIQLFGSTADKETKDASLKVMSFNVRLFDFYNWTGGKETKGKILDMLDKEAPEILCFQEFYVQDTSGHITLSEIKKRIPSALYSQVLITTRLNHHLQNFGIATYSKYPIVGASKIEFEKGSNNACIIADIVVEGDTFRVFNMHLQSIHFEPDDYTFMENITTNDEEENISGSRQVLRKLRDAFIKRAKQAQMVREKIDASPHPVIVCGDFNDTPTSYAYNTISEGLVDAFTEAGSGFGETYKGHLPAMRIDYILHSPELTTEQFDIMDSELLSDHYPIIAYISSDTLR